MKNQKVKKLFAFSYGGNNDFGEIMTPGETAVINFPKDAPTAYGFAIRNCIDANLNDAKKLILTVESTDAITLTIEFKTLISNGAPEIQTTYCLPSNEPYPITLNIPPLSSNLKEIVFVISKFRNPDIKANIKFSNIELI